MRIWMLSMLLLLLSTGLFAQAPIPGTFTTVPTAPMVQYGTPILSAPVATLGSGLTPTVVTNRQTYIPGAPQAAVVETETAEGAAAQSSESNQQGAARQTASVPKHFDFGYGDNSGLDTGVGESQSLAEIARATRRGNAQAFSGRTITNDDVNKMNQQFPAGSVPAPQQPQKAPGMSANQ